MVKVKTSKRTPKHLLLIYGHSTVIYTVTWLHVLRELHFHWGVVTLFPSFPLSLSLSLSLSLDPFLSLLIIQPTN
jgi:hypothetical protein